MKMYENKNFKRDAFNKVTRETRATAGSAFGGIIFSQKTDDGGKTYNGIGENELTGWGTQYDAGGIPTEAGYLGYGEAHGNKDIKNNNIYNFRNPQISLSTSQNLSFQKTHTWSIVVLPIPHD